ncbi:hypothetical protein [Pseudorhodoferax sp.]|uniref:hypothetical protein n=1 Tax=Pseudorhodoferax sp. TaxID=1993553 RepID=UPI0039E53ED1
MQSGPEWVQYGCDLALLGGDDGLMDVYGYVPSRLSDNASSPFTDTVLGSTRAVQAVPEPGMAALWAVAALAVAERPRARPRRGGAR